MIPRILSDTKACEGRRPDHPYRRECDTCRRLKDPADATPMQRWIRGWGGHGECPDWQERKL